MKASEIRELLKLLNRPSVISFAGGIPDPALFPAEALAHAGEAALSGPTAATALQYSVSEGYLPLREWIVGHMARLGVSCDVSNVLITSGSQQALDYLGKLFLSPEDTALVQWPTYLGALGAFNAYEPRFDRLQPGDNRTAKDIAADAEQAGSRVKLSYVTPEFANPTGITLSRAERLAVLEQARALDAMVIEDAAYEGLRYDGSPVPPILALEQETIADMNACRTLYCGTFSKTLSPGLRVGWVVGAQDVIDQLVLIKQAADLHTSTLNQILVTEVVAQGFADHLEQLTTAYGARRDEMLTALAREMPDGVSWSHPEGGMFIWLTLPDQIDGAELLQYALDTYHIAFVPGQAFFADGSGANTLRLSFSCASAEQTQTGIHRLGQAIRHFL
nr:PLP-dependent aminotransferase family protein [Tritonibacter litoralis]